MGIFSGKGFVGSCFRGWGSSNMAVQAVGVYDRHGGLGICRPVVCRQVLFAHFRQASGERGVQQVCTEHHHGNGIPEFQFGQLLCGLGTSERC